ncbi:hypothetical protein SAMN04487995_2929 [Dyadobacter koreensis]|uniref:Anti-sigma regulatory factor (Ser/Thr protein kinase) n=1 Tax=Dyadobacter koreensis TaxID=408657 RepID=A0A1H6V4I3_9BACT|nr:hypothetical protein [Dyadobacter koreensis]SEI99441.1 hypothetical protein SAMN04487995_2929 [Dyadobacter koreensis]
MRDPNHKKTFIFRNQAEGLASIVRSCVDYIEEQNEFLCVPEDIHPKIKWTITELLINGAKHSGSAESELVFTFALDHLLIEKVDSGNPLHLVVNGETVELSWPLIENLKNQHFEVYRNGMDSLQIYTENSEIAHFRVHELEDEEMPMLLVNTSEHFGLMIIAKASDKFSYAYRSETGQNIFSIVFNYSE